MGLQLLTSPVTEPMCQPEPALILGRDGQQTGMRTGKVCESCLMNLLEHTEDMTESRDGRQNSLQLQPGTSPFSKYSCTVKSRHPCLSWIFLGAIFFLGATTQLRLRRPLKRDELTPQGQSIREEALCWAKRTYSTPRVPFEFVTLREAQEVS